MKKDLFLKTIFFSLGILIFSCSNGFTDKKFADKKTTSAANNGKAYIVISDKTTVARMAQQTVSPQGGLSSLTDITLTGKLGSNAEETLATAGKYDDFPKGPIALDPALDPENWTFTLTAKLDGITFSGSLTEEISAGTTTPLVFTLEAAVSNGGLDIKMRFPDEATQVNLVINKLPSGTEIFNFVYSGDTEYPIQTDEYNKKYIEYQNLLDPDDPSLGLEPGTYSLTYSFHSENVTEALNTVTLYAQVSKGFTTSDTITIDDLNEIYSINYKAYKDGETAPAGISSQTGNLPLASGTVVYAFYTRKTEVTLPALSLIGYVFDGWYNEADDSKVENWSVNEKTGDLTLYAKWTVETQDTGINVSFGVDTSTISVSVSGAVFTAATGYSSYSWTLDGAAAPSGYVTSNNVLNLSSITVPGVYDITLTATKTVNGNTVTHTWTGQYQKS